MTTPQSVPFFNYPWAYKHQAEIYRSIFDEVCSRGAYIMQKDLSDFELTLAEFMGAPFSLGVGNATDALEIALAASCLGPGDEVIFCSHTMVATASAIAACGATPVPVEAGVDHLIDPESVVLAITSHTKAIMPTQLNGRTANMDALEDICVKHGLRLFEDAAQALGSTYKGRAAGTFGDASCISFYPAKTLGCFGDAGALVCSNSDLHHKCKLMRDHGRDPETGDVLLWGRNSRMDNIQAAVLNHNLSQYKDTIRRRRDLAAIYHDRLQKRSELLLPPPPVEDGDHFDVYQNYEIEADDRDGLKRYLSDNGVGTLIQWGGKAVHQFKKLGFKQVLPVTDRIFDRCIMLPLNLSLVDDDVHYVCDHIDAFYGVTA